MREWRTLDDGQKSNVCDLTTAARRLRSVVNDILAFPNNNSFVLENRLQEEVLSFNIRDVIDTAISYHLWQIETSKLNVYTDILPDISLDVVGAKCRLLSILDHLIGNAVKFTPSGSVTVRVGQVWLIFFCILQFAGALNKPCAVP